MNGSILDYRLPRFLRFTEGSRTATWCKTKTASGPYGAKGGGEASLNSMAANIANAVDPRRRRAHPPRRR
jgi:CO/xanthine dehydrogenase Mo-binding subunit